MDFQTAIKTLELNAGFSLVDVKRNYYKLSLKWHPDKNTSINSTKKFQEIAEAYEILRDKTKRSQYDSSKNNPFGGSTSNRNQFS